MMMIDDDHQDTDFPKGDFGVRVERNNNKDVKVIDEYPRGTGGGAGDGLPDVHEIASNPHTRFSLKLVA